jgi:hypothetical protein
MSGGPDAACVGGATWFGVAWFGVAWFGRRRRRGPAADR